MHRGVPEHLNGIQDARLDQLFDALGGDHELGRAKEPFAGSIKRNEQDKLQRVDDVIHGLNGRLIEFKYPSG